jgi:hypothetical protein
MAIDLFDFPECPSIDDGPDLRDMSRVDVAALARELVKADVVTVVNHDGSYTILKGEVLLQHPHDTGRDRTKLTYLTVQVANDRQAEMLAGSLAVGQMRDVDSVAPGDRPTT